MITVTSDDVSNGVAKSIAHKITTERDFQFLYSVVRGRNSVDALIALEGYISALAEHKRWREITKGPCAGSPDLLEYFKLLATEVAGQKHKDEDQQKLFISTRATDFLLNLSSGHSMEEKETFERLAEFATETLLQVNPSRSSTNSLVQLIKIGGEPVKRGIRNAIKTANTETALYYIGVLPKISFEGYLSPYRDFVTAFWYSITARENTEGQGLWSPIIATLREFEEFVGKISYFEKPIPVDKEQILTASLAHIQKMCAFAKAVQALPKVIQESGIPIDTTHTQKKIELKFDVGTCRVTEIIVPLYTSACDFYDQYDTHTWRPIEVQKSLVAAMKIKLKDALRTWSEKHGIAVPEPKLTGELRPPEVKPEPQPQPPPVLVE